VGERSGLNDGFATVGAALLGAGIAIVGLVISKESKVSEFRQQWIDGLRADVASLVSAAIAIQIRPMQAEHFRDLTLRLKEFECRISLRFKRGDEQSQHLPTLVQEIVSVAPACEAAWQFEERLKKLKEATQEMRKGEWERVKLGEKNYVRTLRYARFSAMGLFIVHTIWLFVSLVVFPLVAWLPEQFKG
jgi:hypothetical protein